MKKTGLVTSLALACAALWWFSLAPQTDEQLIISRLNEMAVACSKNNGETAVGMAMKNSELSNLIAPFCSVSIEEAMVDGTFQPLELAGQISRARTLFSSLSGSVGDIEVHIAPDGKTATVEYSVRVVGTHEKDGGSFDESRDLRSEMRKIDGEWLFASFEIRRVLER